MEIKTHQLDGGVRIELFGVQAWLLKWVLRLGRPGIKYAPSNRITHLLGSLFALCEDKPYNYDDLCLSGKRQCIAGQIESAFNIQN